MTDTEDNKLVFGIGPGANPGDNATLIIGISEGAWNYIKDGKTNTLDLSQAIGIPLQLMIYGGKTRESCKEIIIQHNKNLGIPSIEHRDREFGIDDKNNAQ